jgi:DNA-binding NarL/FixJ family response regulator
MRVLLAFETRIMIAGEASNGKEAIRLVEQVKPDLVLMDVQMPIMNGLKATQVIKSSWPATKVVIYTIFPSYQEEAYQVGADYFLIKGSPGITPAQIILSFFTAPKHES